LTEIRREIWAWASYDFANSAYSTTVAAVVFNVYFATVVVGPKGATLFGATLPGSAVWGYSVSLSMLLVAVSAPLLGAMADFAACKKRLLILFCYVGVTATAFLGCVGPGDVWLGALLFVVSNLALESSLTFYNAFLPEITTPERMGRVSGFGWALGYVGGVLCLILNLLMVRRPDWFGIPDVDHLPVRMALTAVAVWWGLFSLPALLWLKEKGMAKRLPSGVGSLRFGLGQIVGAFREVRHYPELAKFLLAFLIYNDGIQTVIVMAAPFAAEALGMSQRELIWCFILIQAVAFVGSLLFGYLADRVTTKTSINVTLWIWSAAMCYVLAINQSWQFWLLGVVVGLVLGGSQSASRALFAEFTPPQNSAEFFGFFSVSGKFASLIGPALFAGVVQLTGSTRYATASIVVLFLVGLALLAGLDESKGRLEGRRSLSFDRNGALKSEPPRQPEAP
jgi:UMF1 family MFS transporter